MTRLAILAPQAAMAEDIQKSLAVLWPDAVWGTETADVTITLDKAAGITLKCDGQSCPVKTPVRLVQLVHMIREMAARPVIRRIGDYQLDMASRLWHAPQSEAVTLTEKEVALLVYLADQSPQPVTREDLLRHVWKYADGADTHTVETHLYRLRQKIEAIPDQPTIVVSTRQGYMLGKSCITAGNI